MDPDDLRQMAAEELAKSDPEIQRAAFEQAFREADPENAELLDRAEELLEEVQPHADEDEDSYLQLRKWPDPAGTAIRAGWQREHEGLRQLGHQLLQRLGEFRKQTNLTIPDELYPNRDAEGDTYEKL